MLRGRGRPSRFLAAVVFIDIADSTEVAARLGDQGWKQLLERHLRTVRRTLRRFGGREVDTAGDGLYATFQSPAQAIRFALEVAESAAALGVPVRSGIHMGEIELIGGKAGGIAAHIGARISALAEPGEVLVSGTVRDLVTGSGIGFGDRGITQLKGVPGQWTLYSAKALDQTANLPAEARAPLAERLSNTLQSTRARVALVLAIVAALIGAAALVSVLLRPRLLPGIEANSVGRISAAENGIVSGLQVGSLPDAIAFGEGSLWVTDTTTGSVARIDPQESRIIQTIRVGSSPNAVAVGHGAVWVANGGDRTVSRVSPATNEQIAPITVGNGPSGVATDDSWVWVTNRLDGTLVRIDPLNHDIATFAIGSTPAGVASTGTSVWVSDFDTGSVIRFDPATGASVARIPVGNGPTSIAAEDDQVWVVNSRDGTVTRIDPTTNSVVATIAVGLEPGTLVIGGSVWVTVSSTTEIVRIDPATNTVQRHIDIKSRPRGIAMAGGDPWFTARAPTGDHLGGTLRIITEPDRAPGTLDPVLGGGFGVEPLFLTNDGLVGFKRVGGSDGLTLVPNLAVSMPTPTDGGRTYTFQLRSGITYSDGTPLRALDVLRSFERAFIVDPAMLYFFGGLEGAEPCAKTPEACDLSPSIVIDDAAGTVTFRLLAPDAEFLYKLAQPWAFVLPAVTARKAATAPLPATGPYMAQPFDADGGLRLVRNPRFHEWSHEAQPNGFAEEIIWRIATADEDPLTEVAAAEADWAAARVPADRVEELRIRFPDQLHAVPSSQTWFESMNTTMPPFDREEVRRAVNLATDRARVVELFGGSVKGRITCQATPPGFPGYEPYCPFTVDPDATGTWGGPDMAAARELLAGANIRGVPVTVRHLDFPEHQAIGAYFEGLLDDLGFDASLEVISFDELDTLDAPTADIQMIGLWFGGGYRGPSTQIAGVFTCPDFRPAPGAESNFAAFCDRDIDADALRATELQATDPSAANRLWAEIDHRIVDRSPAVAVFNPIIDLAFVSRRVGNVQLHPVLGVLPGQMWVQ